MTTKRAINVSKRCAVTRDASNRIVYSPPIDAWSIGHVVFGLVATSWMLLIVTYSPPLAQIPTILLTIVLALLLIAIFTWWEIFEHSWFKTYVYAKIEPNWYESPNNSIMDIIIGSITSIIVLVVWSIWFVGNDVFVVSLFVVAHSLVPIAILLGRHYGMICRS